MAVIALLGAAHGGEIDSGDKLVESVVNNCAEMGCVKEKVLTYLDNVLDSQEGTARKAKVSLLYFTTYLVQKVEEFLPAVKQKTSKSSSFFYDSLQDMVECFYDRFSIFCNFVYCIYTQFSSNANSCS